MTDTDDLRRLAEEALATEDDPAITVDPQAILALLDAERDLRNERDDLAMRNSGLEYSAYAWKGQAAAAERRVAALEEGLDRWGDHSWSCAFIQHALTCDCGYLEARALLSQSDSVAAASSEHDHYHGKDDHWHTDPAALPAEDDSVAAQALIDSWGGTEDQWGNFYPHEPVSEASDE